MIHKKMFDGMWLAVFNYSNLHDFALIYFIDLHVYKYK